MNNSRIKILHLEDAEYDAVQIHRVLRDSKFDYEIKVVDSRELYVTELENFRPDLIISDHSLPSFNSLDALEILKESSPNTPFILVTGAVSEEFAAQIMKNGADDYILKDRPQRLNGAVVNALEKYSLNVKLQQMQGEHEYLASIVNYSDDAILSKKLDGTISTWNKSAERIFGYSASEIIGKHITTIIPENKYKEEEDILDKICKGQVIKHYETTRLSKAGKLIHVSITTSPLKNVVGEIIGVSTISRDITEQKAKEIELLESRNQYFELINKLSAAVYTCDTKGQIVMFNKAAEDLWGRAPDPKKDRWCGAWELYDKSGNRLQHDNCSMALSIKYGRSVPGQEVIIKRPDGSIRHIITNPVLTYNLNGLCTGAINLLLDITGLRLAEKSHRQSETNLRQIVDLIPHLIFVNDQSGNFIDVNRRFTEFLGLADREHLMWSGENNSGSYFDHGMNFIKVDDEVLVSGKKKVIPETRLTDYKGRQYIFRTIRVPYTLAESGQKAVLNIAMNITEAKALENELRLEKTKLKAIIDNMNAGLVVADRDGKFIMINDIASELLMMDKNELTIKGWSAKNKLFYEDKVTRCLYEDLPLVRALNGERIDKKVLYVNNESGCEGVFLSVSGSPIPGANGEIVAGVVVIRDVTEVITANEKLKESFDKLQSSSEIRASILDALPANVALLDENGIIVEVNESWIRFGRENSLNDKHYCVGSNYIDVSDRTIGEDEETGKKIADGIRQVINGTSRFLEIEYPCHSPSEQRWFKAEVAPLAKGHGKGAVVMHVNITERKKAEEELRHSHLLIKKLTDQIPLAVYQFEMAPDGSMSFPFMSNGFERIFSDMTVDQILQDATTPFKRIHPDELPAFLSSIENSRKNLSIWEEEYRSREADGSYKWLLASSRPEKKADGTVVWYGYIQDINQRVAAEYENKFKAKLLDTIGQAVVSTDLSGKITFWNQAASHIYGWKSNEAIGKNIIDITSDAMTRGEAELIFSKLLRGETWSGEFNAMKKDGTRFPAFISNSPVFDKFGNLDGIIGVSNDISERKENEIERMKIANDLIQRYRDLEQFTFIISHNLRAPIANIIGFADCLQDTSLEKEEYNELLQGLSKSITGLDTVIKDINSILQVKREVNEKKELIKFSLIVTDVSVSIENLINKHQVKIEHDFSEIDEIVSLKAYMHSIFYNLISNSIKYRKPNEAPVIKITSKLQEGRIILTFKDNGLGFDMKSKGDKIFGLYNRFHSHVEGKGMGLFMVKIQVEAIEGKISVVSKPNQGTEFTIIL
jgi:PAS domain S-box-containing protein